jgi:sugar (pentulose or hexulose) kinase
MECISVGGGSNNACFYQVIADLCGRQILAGPSEATAFGNLLMQLHALGIINKREEAKRIKAMVFNSTDIKQYMPVQ